MPLCLNASFSECVDIQTLSFTNGSCAWFIWFLCCISTLDISLPSAACVRTLTFFNLSCFYKLDVLLCLRATWRSAVNSVVQLFSKTTGELLLLSHASGFTSVNPSVNFWKNLHYKLSLAHFSILFLTVLTQLNKVSASVILALLSLLLVRQNILSTSCWSSPLM